MNVTFRLLLLFTSKGVIAEPYIAAMSNSGWNNEACLAAAKELKQSFQKSGGKNAMRNTGREKGNRSSSSSILMKRQESFQHTPRPAPPPPGNLNVPPPSHRNYTETLVPDTRQIPRGPIMKGSLDFLNRTDSTIQKSSDSVQAKATHTEDVAKQARSSTMPSAPVSRSIATVKVNHESAAEDHNIPKPAPAPAPTPTPTPTPTPATPEAPKAGSNVDLLRGLTTHEPIQCAVEVNMGSSNMAEKFFSLMSQDSDEESEDALDTEAEDKAVNKSNATDFLRYTSDDLLKLRANAKNDVLPLDSIVKRISTVEDTNTVGDTNVVGDTNTPAKTKAIGNSSSMAKNTVMGNAIAIGKSKLAAVIDKASSHLTLPRQTSSPHRSTKVNPQATPIKLTITKPDAVQASTKIVSRSGVTQNVIGKLEVPQVQAKPKPETAVVQKVDDKSRHEVVQKIVDETEVPQIQAKPQSHASTVVSKPKAADNEKASDQATPQGETRGKTETSKELDSPKLRPQAPGFVPAAPAASLSSSEMMLQSAQGTGSLVASPLADCHTATPNVMPESLVHSAPSSGQIIAVTPIQFADGHVIPGPSSGLYIIHPAPSLDQMPTPRMQMSTPGMQMHQGTFSADLSIRETESSNAAANTARPRKPTKGLTASMWANSSNR
ncbi:hypothetical protein KAF25_009222 [Fusarium avenaceum]|uniref:Uncharacterized protein n=1 Tax=Fusarium avenaceum TaxID=40199 RepID=A0A9P7HHW2_9HYPO|nr:hypothetical protein KAF25_009222 [Fusarium avenaceum]